jgi:HlyD family secretion protein
MIRRIKALVLGHKVLSAIVALVVLGGGWYGYQALTATSGTTSYILGTVTQGTVVASVSESGQVSASNQLNVQPQVSGTITWVGVSPGDKVAAGQALATIDNTTAKQAVDSAQASLKTAELQFQQDQAQAPFTYQTDLNNLQTDKDNLATAYVNTFNAISNAYLDLPNVMTGTNDTLYGYELDKAGEQWNVDVLTNMFQNDDRVTIKPFATVAETDYQTAVSAYKPSLADYQGLTRTASPQAVGKMLTESITTETAVAQALQSDLNFYGKVTNLAGTDNLKLSSTVTTLQTNATNYLATVNNDLNSLLAEQKTLDTDNQAITNDQNAITLFQVGNTTAGDNPISLQVEASNIAQQKQNLQNLENTLAEYTVVAPFSGTIAAVSAQVGASSGSGVATEITNDQIATLSLNEVDAAKIKLGDKVTLTFDAITDLTLTGSVAEIDPVGTVSQGVVSYNVKVDFTSQDSRIKTGMTVNAAIQTDVHQNVLVVPSSAVKTQNSQSYVLAFSPALSGATSSSPVTSATTPSQIPVVTGISDDTNVEITSGLTEGEQIVVKTVTSSAKTSATAATTATASRSSSVRIGGPGGL